MCVFEKTFFGLGGRGRKAERRKREEEETWRKEEEEGQAFPVANPLCGDGDLEGTYPCISGVLLPALLPGLGQWWKNGRQKKTGRLLCLSMSQ